jgi:hypothetical protein
MTRRLACAALLGAWSLVLGCADDLPKATEIVHMRMLGAKLEVVGDETRATPKPGEQVKVTFDTVFPTQRGSTRDSQTLLISCTAPTRYTGGIAICQEFLDAAKGADSMDVQSALAMGGSTKLRCSNLPGPRVESGGVALQCLAGAPALTLDVRKDFSAARMLFLGVICENGTPLVDVNDPALFSCEHNSGETVRVNGLIPIQHTKADVNHNPSLGDLEIVMDPYTKPWLAPAGKLPADNMCRSDEQPDQSDPLTLPYADPGDHKLLLSYDGSAREKVDGELEELELTIYTTAGGMERRFTLWTGTDELNKQGELESDLDWDPPAAAGLPSSGKLVRFFITLRDQRGGFDFAERAACLH